MNTTDQSRKAPPQSAYERAREIERQQVIAEYQSGPKWGVNSAAWPDQRRQSYAGLRFISMTVIVFGWLIFVGGVVAGIAMAVHTEHYFYYDSHPLLGGGRPGTDEAPPRLPLGAGALR